MKNNKESKVECCSFGPGCCGGETPKQNNKQVVIDFLYLDLSVCE